MLSPYHYFILKLPISTYYYIKVKTIIIVSIQKFLGCKADHSPRDAQRIWKRGAVPSLLHESSWNE